MNFIVEKLNFIYRKIKQSCADYRVTVIVVEVITFYMALGLIWDDLNFKYAPHVTDFLFHDWAILAFLMLFCLASMFVESLFIYEKKQSNIKIARITGFIFSVVITCAIVWGIRQEGSGQVFNITRDIIGAWCQRFTVGYVILLILGIVYVCHRKSGAGFIEYSLHLIVNFAVATAIYFILLIDVSLVILIIKLLFLNRYSSLGVYGVVLVTGIYYVPACIMAMNNIDSEISDRISIILMKYVLSVMTICAFIVVYIYLLKILIVWEMPSNEIFGIVAGMFCLGMPIWIIDYFYRDDTGYMRFLQKLPYGLIPLIPVQTYAICVRIYHNGLTPSRYLGVFMILFEIIMLFVWRFWREKLERVLLILGAGVVVAIFIPGLNMYSLSVRWQSSFLKSYYNKVNSQEQLTQEEYERLEGSYDYLKWEPVVKNVVEQYDIYDADFVKLLVVSGVEEENLTKLQHHGIHCCQMVGTLKNDGNYCRFDMLNQDEGYDASGEDRLPADFSAFIFYKRGSDEQERVTVDLSSFAERCFAYEEEHPDAGKEEFSEAMRPYIQIQLDDDRVFYLNHFEINYRDGIKDGEEYCEISSVNISGVMLSK